LKYDAAAQQFSITTFANSLEEDFMTLLSNPLTRSVASGFDLNTNVLPSLSLSMRNESVEEEEVEEGEGWHWTIVKRLTNVERYMRA
jgi:hypothetical protein